jgi:hypothetical protein
VKFLIWGNRQGPKAAFAMPKDGKPTDHAYGPGGPWGRPWRELSEKGHGVSWEAWAQSLTERPPYFGRWRIMDFPKGTTAAQALVKAGEKDSTSLLGEPEQG